VNLNARSTLFDKVWQEHVIEDMGDGWALLHVDRHLLHDLSGSRSMAELDLRSLPVPQPQLAFATPDHAVSSSPDRMSADRSDQAQEAPQRLRLKNGCASRAIRFYDLGESGQGIVHVIGPELGIVLPGTTVLCGDSHTCTNGALGAMAFGIGSSELTHALATQTVIQRKPKNMRIWFEGHLPSGVTAKDLILYTIGKLGVSAGVGHAVEYAGQVIDAMTVEARMTICNLSIELGAKIGMIAPDQRVYDYLNGRRFAPSGALLNSALSHWRTLFSEQDAIFERDERINVKDVTPMVSWGTSPEQVVSVNGVIPDATQARDQAQREAWRDAREYMGISQGDSMQSLRVDRVFIGSCTNSRLSDLREAASLLRGRRVASHVTAWVVPGSEDVKRAAQREGLDTLFRAAGFEWREPGCSMCVAANGEIAAPGERVVSTSNRNFVGRQGPGVRTHLASPATAVASALAGVIADPREL
jgi:3-isopropylmalate/(R)-2-methylmalate dehydratase large subunit